jgi:hypothetical protein
MEKLRISMPLRRWALITAVLVGGLALPVGGGEAAAADAKRVAPGFGCDALEGAGTTPRPALVRASRPRDTAPRHRARDAAPPPPGIDEPPAVPLRAFYTCAATPVRATPVGTGWMAIGPLRRS